MRHAAHTSRWVFDHSRVYTFRRHQEKQGAAANIKPQREELKAALGQYWYRHKAARNQV